MDEVYRSIGQINFTLSRLTFLISSFLWELGIETEVGSFFSEHGTKEKFSSLDKRIEPISSPQTLKYCRSWTEKLIKLIEERDNLTHSLITLDHDENTIRLHNYKNKKASKVVEHKVHEKTISALVQLNTDFIDCHNEGYEIFNALVKEAGRFTITKCNYNSKDYLDSIEKELIVEEQEEPNSGLFKHLDIIKSGCYKGQLYIAKFNHEVAGFALMLRQQKTCKIQLFQIFSKFRKRGVGKRFVKLLKKEFTKNGNLAFTVKNIDQNSQAFWEKLCFIKVESLLNSRWGFDYFLPLIQINNRPRKSSPSIKIVLYKEGDMGSGIEPEPIEWTLPSNNDNLNEKILIPCDPDWNLQITHNGADLIHDRIKDVDRKHNGILRGNFLYIDETKNLVKSLKDK